jgi:hypothetical protein
MTNLQMVQSEHTGLPETSSCIHIPCEDYAVLITLNLFT